MCQSVHVPDSPVCWLPWAACVGRTYFTTVALRYVAECSVSNQEWSLQPKTHIHTQKKVLVPIDCGVQAGTGMPWLVINKGVEYPKVSSWSSSTGSIHGCSTRGAWLPFPLQWLCINQGWCRSPHAAVRNGNPNCILRFPCLANHNKLHVKHY